MSHKNPKVAAWVAACQGRNLEAHYLAYFQCFNQGLYYEAHDVLEGLWLPCRREPHGDFYKGLIQLAGAFVHLAKGRPNPALALFGLAEANLQRFAPSREQLDVGAVLDLITSWRKRIRASPHPAGVLGEHPPPRLDLKPD